MSNPKNNRKNRKNRNYYENLQCMTFDGKMFPLMLWAFSYISKKTLKIIDKKMSIILQISLQWNLKIKLKR